MSIRFEVDAGERTVEFELPAKVYSEQSVSIAAHVFDRRAEVAMAADASSIEVSLKAKSAKTDEAGLRRLGGEFLNELLNQEYRSLVGDFNRKLSNLIVTQALFSARGGETPPEKADESSPEFRAEVQKLMAEAEEEIRRTMPKKIAPQGPPVKPRKEEPIV